MNKTLLSAGIVMLVGLVMMMIFNAMNYTASNDYYDTIMTGTAQQMVDAGKEVNLYGLLYHIGLIVVGLGVAILAFGLAVDSSKTERFRQVETEVSMKQYLKDLMEKQNGII